MRKILLLIAASFFTYTLQAQTVNINLGTTTVATTTLYTTIDLPWELKYGPGDSLWMTTRQGRVFRIHPTNGGSTLLLDHSANVWQSGESGMLGMAFHPNFAITPQVFIVYTYTSGGLNRERLSRFNYSGNTLSGEVILVDGGNIIANTTHNGSRLLILPDNTILMTTGDAANTANPQNNTSLNGKILRVNLDGTIPANNPTPGSIVYSKGHRNPQGLALHPSGKVFETEHGPNNNDEFQIIEAGRNYGWPNVEGYCDNDINTSEIPFCTANNIMQPLASWNPSPGGTWAPNDLIWYSNPAIPEFQNSFLVTFLKTMKLRRITLNAAGDAITGQTDFFVNQWGRLRDITAAPNGDLFLLTNTAPNRIIRIVNPLAAPVPVSLTDYNVNCNGEKFSIKWTTHFESNNKQFLLYRSLNGIDFQLAATLSSSAAGGNSSVPIKYTYTDYNNPSSKKYYKLVSEELNGRLQEYQIISASCNNGIFFTLSPNPASGHAALKWTGILGPLLIKVYNALGQLVYQINTNSFVDLPVNKWSRDLYIITVSDNKNLELFKSKLLVK